MKYRGPIKKSNQIAHAYLSVSKKICDPVAGASKSTNNFDDWIGLGIIVSN